MRLRFLLSYQYIGFKEILQKSRVCVLAVCSA